MTRGTPLVADVGHVTRLTGVVGLGNLALPDDELTVTDLLTTASDAVYDRLDADGHDPTTLSNEEVFERCVAYTFLWQLASHGLLTAGNEEPAEAAARYEALAEKFYSRVRPRKTTGDEARRPDEGVPVVSNFEPGWAFGPAGYQRSNQRVTNDLPPTAR